MSEILCNWNLSAVCFDPMRTQLRFHNRDVLLQGLQFLLTQKEPLAYPNESCQ